MPSALDRAKIRERATRERKSFEDTLRQFVEVPSISMDPAHRPDILRMAELAASTFRRHGFAAEILPTAGNPLVHARLHQGDSLPTVTVYNHMDVQPAGEPEWSTEPFRFLEREGRYFGRGTTDDKGPALSALHGAKAALEAGVRLNINFLWELEEEIGSPNFDGGLRDHAARLATDSVVVSDTVWVARGKPACPAGLRGLATMLIRLETGDSDQHSGTAGGAARNPVAELMQLASEMLDARTGKVKIPGFYDDVIKPTAAELRMFRASGFTVKGFMKDHGFKSLRSRDALDVMKRIWAMPTLEIHGLAGGYQGKGVKTVIPPRAELKLSCRLVPDQRPARMVKLISAFVKQRCPDARLSAEGALEPYRGRTTGELAEAVSTAVQFGFGRRPVFVREGGSIGAVVTMEKRLRVPVLFLGLSLPEHGYHAPNENFDWEQAGGGMAAFARYFEAVAGLGKKPS